MHGEALPQLQGQSCYQAGSVSASANLPVGVATQHILDAKHCGRKHLLHSQRVGCTVSWGVCTTRECLLHDKETRCCGWHSLVGVLDMGHDAA